MPKSDRPTPEQTETDVQDADPATECCSKERQVDGCRVCWRMWWFKDFQVSQGSLYKRPLKEAS